MLLVDDQTATLSMVDAGEAPPTVLAAQPIEGSDATAACDTLLRRLGAEPGAADDIYLIGTSPELNTVSNQLRTTSSIPVQVPDDFAIARGAAMAVEPTTMTQAVMLPDETTAIPPAAEMTQMSPQQGEQLAYSMADDSALLPMDTSEPEDDYAEAPAPRLSTRSLLISNAVVAFAVIGFAVLAVVVAITIRPTASQQPVQGHPNAAPGKFMPPLPTQQQAPLPPVPAGNAAAVLPPGSGLPEVSGPGPQQVAPVPDVPPAPAVPRPSPRGSSSREPAQSGADSDPDPDPNPDPVPQHDRCHNGRHDGDDWRHDGYARAPRRARRRGRLVRTTVRLAPRRVRLAPRRVRLAPRRVRRRDDWCHDRHDRRDDRDDRHHDRWRHDGYDWRDDRWHHRRYDRWRYDWRWDDRWWDDRWWDDRWWDDRWSDDRWWDDRWWDDRWWDDRWWDDRWWDDRWWDDRWWDDRWWDDWRHDRWPHDRWPLPLLTKAATGGSPMGLRLVGQPFPYCRRPCPTVWSL